MHVFALTWDDVQRWSGNGVRADPVWPPYQENAKRAARQHYRQLGGPDAERRVSDGLVPRAAIARHVDADPARYRRERARDRSLLFVAATRARDDLAIFWHGDHSPFITDVLAERALW